MLSVGEALLAQARRVHLTSGSGALEQAPTETRSTLPLASHTPLSSPRFSDRAPLRFAQRATLNTAIGPSVVPWGA